MREKMQKRAPSGPTGEVGNKWSPYSTVNSKKKIFLRRRFCTELGVCVGVRDTVDPSSLQIWPYLEELFRRVDVVVVSPRREDLKNVIEACREIMPLVLSDHRKNIPEDGVDNEED